MSQLVKGFPQRTKAFENVRIDSARWDHYVPREGDVVVATYPKNGTTWMEYIVLNLIHRGAPKPSIHEAAIWVDRKKRRESKEGDLFPVEALVEKLQAQTHRRQFKTHLPVAYLPFYSEVNYIVVGRSNRDVWLSWHNHHRNWLDQEQLPEDPKDFWVDWIEGRVAPQSDWEDEAEGAHPHFRYYQGWWTYRHLENILFVHFDDLLEDLPGEVVRVASFLGIDVSDDEVQTIARETSFGNMKAGADRLLPGAERADVFLNKGTNGRWRELLTEADLALYREARQRAVTHGVDEACLAWLEGDGR